MHAQVFHYTVFNTILSLLRVDKNTFRTISNNIITDYLSLTGYHTPRSQSFPLTYPIVLQQSGVTVFSTRLLHKQLLTRGLVLIQHTLPCIDHPDRERGGAKKKGEPGVKWFIVFALIPLTVWQHNSSQKDIESKSSGEVKKWGSHVPEGTRRRD